MVHALLNFRTITTDEEFKTVLAMTADDLRINNEYSEKELTNDDFLNQLNLCKEVYKRLQSRDFLQKKLMIEIADEARRMSSENGIDLLVAIEKAKEIYREELKREKGIELESLFQDEGASIAL